MTVVVVPCLPVARSHLREAWRSLVGQGYGKEAVDDETVAALLWKSRALPSVIDVLAGLDLSQVRFNEALVDILAPDAAALAKGPLALVAWRRDDELLVEGLILPSAAIEDGGPLTWAEVLVRLAFPFRLKGGPGTEFLDGDDTDKMKVGVSLRRFSLGRT